MAISKKRLRMLASKAGKKKSLAKTRAARKNGKLGGRPGNPEIARIMKERGCTRQRAHQILKSLKGG